MTKQLNIWQRENPTVKVHNPFVFSQIAVMDVTAMRLFLLMLAKWDINAPLEDVIRIQFREIIPNFAGRNGAEFKSICQAMVELKEKIKDVKLEEVKDGIRTFKLMSVLDYLELSEDQEYIEGRFALKIRDYLKRLKGNFTIAELKEIFSLRSYYSTRLYLIGRSFYEGMQEVNLSLEEFKLIMIGDLDTYKSYKFLKRDVINTSVKALESTSAAVVITEKKNGKTVTGLVIKPASTDRFANKRAIVGVFPPHIEKLFLEFDVNQTKPSEMVLQGEVPIEYVQFVFEKIGKSNSDRKASLIHSGIVKKRYWSEFTKSRQEVLYVSPVKGTLTEKVTSGSPRFSQDQIIAAYEAGLDVEDGSPINKKKLPTLKAYFSTLKMRQLV